MNGRDIQALVLDVDGVLTDGRLYYGEQGEQIKVFHVLDGAGIVEWIRRGLKLAILSGRNSPIINRRAQDLGITEVIQGALEKLEPFRQLIDRWGLAPQQVAYIGDDWPDIPPMQQCGFAVAVQNALPEVKQASKLVTRASGGAGAVREAIDYLLSQKRNDQ
ncbi:MAG: 3-deoxy-D-manno-octulosonate 8-phosphate phosphatase KdsC [Phycisphaerae bacterium]|nr:3-deoxy-D-manno-octulosonate 8-phosphate phosphatase KdsC [Phycisphaerae bacterium]